MDIYILFINFYSSFDGNWQPHTVGTFSTHKKAEYWGKLLSENNYHIQKFSLDTMADKLAKDN